VKKNENEGLMEAEMKRFMIGCLSVPCLVLLACVWIVGCTGSDRRSGLNPDIKLFGWRVANLGPTQQGNICSRCGSALSVEIE
jgi:hypothetical protein